MKSSEPSLPQSNDGAGEGAVPETPGTLETRSPRVDSIADDLQEVLPDMQNIGVPFGTFHDILNGQAWRQSTGGAGEGVPEASCTLGRLPPTGGCKSGDLLEELARMKDIGMAFDRVLDRLFDMVDGIIYKEALRQSADGAGEETLSEASCILETLPPTDICAAGDLREELTYMKEIRKDSDQVLDHVFGIFADILIEEASRQRPGEELVSEASTALETLSLKDGYNASALRRELDDMKVIGMEFKRAHSQALGKVDGIIYREALRQSSTLGTPPPKDGCNAAGDLREEFADIGLKFDRALDRTFRIVDDILIEEALRQSAAGAGALPPTDGCNAVDLQEELPDKEDTELAFSRAFGNVDDNTNEEALRQTTDGTGEGAVSEVSCTLETLPPTDVSNASDLREELAMQNVGIQFDIFYDILNGRADQAPDEDAMTNIKSLEREDASGGTDHDTVQSLGTELVTPMRAHWLPEYLERRGATPGFVSDADLEILQPLRMAFLEVVKFEARAKDVAKVFAAMDIDRVEYLLSQPEDLRSALKGIVENLETGLPLDSLVPDLETGILPFEPLPDVEPMETKEG